MVPRTAARDVVFIPSQLLTHAIWADQNAAITTICTPFLADHGSDDSVAGMASRLLAQAPARFHLVAQGMGGFVAFEILRRDHERVQSLVLIGTVASADGPAQSERRRGYSRLVEEGCYADVIEQRLPILVGPRNAENLLLLGALRRMAEETGAATFLRQQAAIIGRPDSRPSLCQIARPTLVLRGEHDGITLPEHQAEIAGLIPRAIAETVLDCGHVPSLEKPDWMAERLRRWLENV